MPKSAKQGITLRDIAAKCGVSAATVSWALRDDPRLRAETIARVRAAADELGYDPFRYHTARRLRLCRTETQALNHVIAIFFPSDFTRWNYFTRIFHGALDELVQARYSLLTHYLLEDSSRHLMPVTLASGEVDGAIVIGKWGETLQQLRRLPGFQARPIVSLVYAHQGCSSVTFDDRQSGYLLGAHLRDLGHRHCLHFYGAHMEDPVHQRMAGFLQAYRDAGLTPRLHELYWSNQAIEASGAAIIRHLRAHPEITAIIGVNDLIALRIRECLLRAGLRVPEDISLTGHDDTDPILDAMGRALLTTVRLPLEELGRCAARLAIAHITGQATAHTTIVLPVALQVRHTTGPAPRA